MRTIQTPGAFSGLAGVPRLLPNALDAAVLVNEAAIKDWVVPRQSLLRLPNATKGVKVQGKVGGSIWEAQGVSTTMSLSGSFAGVEFTNVAAAHLLSDFEVPASYTIIAIVELDTLPALTAFFAGAGAVAAAGTLLFWAAPTGYIRLQHGPTFGLSSPAGVLTTNTKSLVYASFDAGSMTAAIGVNKLTPPTTGTIGAQHGGASRSLVGSTSDGGIHSFDGHVFEWMVLDRAYHLAEHDAARQTLLDTIADVYGITLT